MSRTARASLCVAAAALAVFLPSSLHAQANVTLEFGDVLAGAGHAFEVPIILSFDGNNDAGGFSASACIDPAVVTPTGFAATNLGGHPPGFVQFDVLSTGWTCGVLWELGHPYLSPGTHEVGQFLGDAADFPSSPSTPVELCFIGTSPVDTVVVILGQSIIPTVVPGSITVVPALRRGDTNGDGIVNIADAITLWGMFSSGTTAPPITCHDAADANDDGQVDVADVVTILAYLFQGGSIPAPLLECGPDETPDALDCAESGSC